RPHHHVHQGLQPNSATVPVDLRRPPTQNRVTHNDLRARPLGDSSPKHWFASLTRQSLMLVCVGILFAGGAAGFGVGYTVAPGAKPAAHATGTNPKRNAQTVAKLTRLRTCLARRGLRWPRLRGGPAKFGF